MARPKKPPKEVKAGMLTVRLDSEDRALLEALVKLKADALRMEGLEATASSVLRGLVRAAAAEAGIKPGKR